MTPIPFVCHADYAIYANQTRVLTYLTYIQDGRFWQVRQTGATNWQAMSFSRHLYAINHTSARWGLQL